MSLDAGTRLGVYEIIAPLGAGGMGEVYKARDTRLGRTVAVKVLPATASADADARDRLKREARTLSHVSHPNVCALFDVGEHGNRDYLVMELIEGDALSVRLARGPLPMADVLRHGVEIASALSAAHRQGVVHRDLKPGNILVTRSGVKLVDFGLAKPLTPMFGSDANPTRSIPGPVTSEGTLLGTLQYMAPEQLKGRPADERSDIFALGAVLYEMATGAPAFGGDSAAGAVTAILSAEPPPIGSLQNPVPPAFDRLVRACLAKDPEQRWRSSHDIALQLAAIREGAAHDERGPAPRAWHTRLWWVPWSVAALALAATIVVVLRPPTPGSVTAPIRFALPPPPGGNFFSTVETVSMALSPDGSTLAFIALGPSGPSRVWLRPLSSIDASPVDGTENASSVFWSPDGRALGFFAGGKLKRLDLSGGGPVTLCDVQPGIGHSGAWGRGGRIVFASVQGEAIFKTSSGGEPPVELIKNDLAHGVVRVTWPLFLPDGERFVYAARDRNGLFRLMLSDPAESQPREVMTAVSNVQYVDPGYLLFARDGTLLAQRFDVSRGRASGDAIAVADTVAYNFSTGAAMFTASLNGVLAYQSHRDRQRVAWINRDGSGGSAVGAPGAYQFVRISPDGRQVTFDRGEPRTGTPDVWIRDLERGVEMKVTSDPGSEIPGVWLRGGESIVYSADRGGPPHLFRKNVSTGHDEELLPAGGFQESTDVSPDGTWLVYAKRERGDFDLSLLPLSATAAGTLQWPSAPFSEYEARFSPDGHAVAFGSTESGRGEVYVAPFPALHPRVPVSNGGAGLPRWSRDGRTLFYLSESGLRSVPVRTFPGLQVGAAANVFPLPATRRWRNFDVAPDGRFLAIIPEEFADLQPLTVVMNWPGRVAR